MIQLYCTIWKERKKERKNMQEKDSVVSNESVKLGYALLLICIENCNIEFWLQIMKRKTVSPLPAR